MKTPEERAREIVELFERAAGTEDLDACTEAVAEHIAAAQLEGRLQERAEIAAWLLRESTDEESSADTRNMMVALEQLVRTGHYTYIEEV